MVPHEWMQICSRVTDEMRAFTHPFVTPLAIETEDDVRLTGSGSFAEHNGTRILLTCQHVAQYQPVNYRFFHCDEVFRHSGIWCMTPPPTDVACARMTEAAWNAAAHEAKSIPLVKFAMKHAPCRKEELLFFRGFSGENEHYGFGVHLTNGTGYCSQERENSRDDQTFEIFWDAQHSKFSDGTTPDARANIQYDNPRGFSGSLVWNTRFLEVSAGGKTWTPEEAVVTGMLQRWDDKAKTLLVWRVEHLLAWLA